MLSVPGNTSLLIVGLHIEYDHLKIFSFFFWGGGGGASTPLIFRLTLRSVVLVVYINICKFVCYCTSELC